MTYTKKELIGMIDGKVITLDLNKVKFTVKDKGKDKTKVRVIGKTANRQSKSELQNLKYYIGDYIGLNKLK